MSRTTTRSRLLGAVVLAAAVGLTACGTTADPATDDATDASEEHTDDDEDDHADDDHDEEDDDHRASEAATRTPRLALTYDGGILVLDAATLDLVADLELDGFNRINSAGDGRHALVSTEGGWAPLDLGTWSSGHGDHDHYYTATPVLHDVLVEAEIPAHVVNHDGLTALFDDGTGDVTVVQTETWTEQIEAGEVTPVRTYTTANAHHGVAVAESDGTLLVTEGNDEGRSTVRLLDGQDAEVDAYDECPGVHGETVAGTETIVVGCEDGVVVRHEDHLHKIASPDEFGRIGNAFGTSDSHLVLGDYKTDPEGGIGLTQITLVDTEAESLTVVDTGTTYTWRGLARGAQNEALVLGTDGSLRVIDPATAEVLSTIEVTAAWEVPAEWQTAHPALIVLDGMAYVTEPATNQVHIVDYVGGAVWRSAELPVAPVEIVGVTG